MQLAQVRRDVHGFQVARAQAEVAAHAGREARPFAADAREWPLALASESLALVRQDLASATGRRALRLQRLSEALQRNIAHARSGDAAEAWRQTVPGPEHPSQVPLHSVLDTLSRTDNRTHRQSLLAVAATSCEPLWAAWARQIEAAQAADLDLSAAADDARTMLADTRDMYADVLGWWLSRSTRLKPFPRGAEAHDVLWALRSLPFDPLAKPGEVRSLADAFRGIGLEPRWQLDDEARAGRWPGARVRVGDGVLVSHRVRGGFDDARTALRSIGTALHRAGCDPEAPPEDRLLGDAAAGTGELLAGLLLDAGWAKRRFDLDDPDQRRVLALADLADARVKAALVVITREALARGVSQALATEAGEQLSAALLGQWPPGALPLLLPDPFEATSCVTARRLGAQLLEHVRERCNEDWWANPRTGSVLGEVFRPGGLYTPDELAQQLGLPPFRGWTSLWAQPLG